MSEHLKSKVKWIHTLDTEWVYCGLDEDLKIELIKEQIAEHFENSELYVSINRTESFQTNINSAVVDITKFFGEKDFMLWDIQFKKVIEFNRIGVFRKGEISK